MHIGFEQQEFRELCRNEGSAIAALGPGVAEVLFARLADIRAAETLAELIVGNPRVDPNDASTYLLDLRDYGTLRFRTIAPKGRKTESERTNPARVSRILVVAFEARNARRD